MELDKDLAARQEARALARGAHKAQLQLCRLPQEKLDAIVEAMAGAFSREAANLAEMAVRETGFGNAEDKTLKNRFASETVAAAVRGMKTVGLLGQDEKRKIWEIGVPVGVIAAIVPSTNPTSTVCYKALIAIKAGNAIVFSPHPKAIAATRQAAKIVAEAAERAGAPAGTVSCLSIPSLQGCQELMAAPEVKLILATGGPGMVKAAYSSGKPAIGVGAGNGPAYIHRSADIPKAVDCILRSKTFDHGTVCASEQSIIVEKSMEATVLRETERRGFYLMNPQEASALAKLLFKPNGGLSPEAVLEKVVEVLGYEGSGHTFAMHASDEAAVRRFAERVPVSRFLVNTPAALGGIGKSTGLFPALTLGCGAVGGSSSSNNISPLDLINIRRVAWNLEPQAENREVTVDSALVELLTAKILERLG